MGLNMKDFERYVNNFKNMQSEFKTWLKNWITKEGYITLADIISNTPEDTGRLKGSWELKNLYIKLRKNSMIKWIM